MSHSQRPLRFSMAGRLTLLFAVPLILAAATGAMVSYLGATPGTVFLAVLCVGLPVGALVLSKSLTSTISLLEALSDGVDGWHSGDFSLRLAAKDRHDELGRLVELYNSMGNTLRRERNEVRQRELLLHTVVESSPAAVLLISARHRIELANQQARILFGGGRRLRGASWKEVPLPPGLAAAIDNSTDQLLSVDLEGREETLHITRRTLELNARRHTLLMVHRITGELRRQEIAAWKKVLRVIAHELNNSLAPIRSVAHTARRMLDADRPREKLAVALETIDDSAARLHQFIDGYARFARLPAPRLESIDLLALVGELQHLEPFSLPPPATGHERLDIQADPAQLQQALINLIRNAREAGSPPDEVVLEIEDLGPRGTRIHVLDRGPGMDPELLPRAQLPFFSTKPEGTGLGLALAREIVEAHGGTINLANRQDGGLRVSCYLPRQRTRNPESSRDGSSDARPN